MSACLRFRRWIAAAIDHELGPAASLDLARHLDACRLCRKERARQERLAGALDRLPSVEEPADLSSRILRRVRAALPAGRTAGALIAISGGTTGTIAALIRATGPDGRLRLRIGLEAFLEGIATTSARAFGFLFSDSVPARGRLVRAHLDSVAHPLGEMAPLGLGLIVSILLLTLLVAVAWRPATPPAARIRPEN